ncbi:MAG: CotH kinase family protein [Actinobacteria bacterium]|nr:CotH kinase family protein [Actinomycetota bacterium]
MGVTCAVVAACAFVVPSALAVGGPANWMYEPTTFTEIRLTLPPASEAALEVEPKEYVEGTFELAETDGTPGSAGAFSAPLTVGIELKGNLGSLRRLSEKAAFKVKFDKFVKGQSFMGLEKMTLNNMVQDPSMIHETVTYAAFHKMGVPAPHTGFTYLTVNGKSYGVHLNIETQDVQSLENAFGTPFQAPPQHLYAGEYGADATTAKWEAFEVSEGKKKNPGDKADLEALVAAVEASMPTFSQRVEAVADLSEMTKNWLVEKYVGNWDGYAGKAPDSTHPNNYYLYSDAAGKFSMMPWGTDQTWQSWRHLGFGGGGGVLFSDCLAETVGCNEQYLAAGREALVALNAPQLDDLARCTAAALRPWQEYEAAISEPEKLPDPGADGEENLEAAEAEAVSTRKFIALRPAELATYLGEPTPTAVPTGAPCPALRPIGGFPEPQPADEEVTPGTTGPDAGVGAPSSTPPASTPASPVAPVLALGRRQATGKSIAMTLGVPGPGRVTVEGKAGRPAWTACRGSANVTAAGSAAVTCRLTDRFVALLHERWRRVRIDVLFEPAAGSPEHLRQPIRLRRR